MHVSIKFVFTFKNIYVSAVLESTPFSFVLNNFYIKYQSKQSGGFFVVLTERLRLSLGRGAAARP